MEWVSPFLARTSPFLYQYKSTGKTNNVKEHEVNYELIVLLVELSFPLLNQGIHQLDFISNPSFRWHFCSAQQSNTFWSDMSDIFKENFTIFRRGQRVVQNSQLENLHVFQQAVHDVMHFEDGYGKVSIFKKCRCVYLNNSCSSVALLLACYHRKCISWEVFHVVLIKYLSDGVQNDWLDSRYGQVAV